MFVPVFPFVGAQPINDCFLPDTTKRHPVGTKIEAVDPYWGQGEFLYVKSNAAIVKGSVVVWDESFVATLLPNTANLGFSVGVAMAPMAAGTYGWVQVAGRAVYATNATVAADAALGITAAGILGANTAGKQILGIRNRIAATGTATNSGTTTNGSSAIVCGAGYDGFFLGMALSGTGIPASSIVAKLDSDGKTIYMGSAVGTIDKTATASGTVTVTGTYTAFGSGVMNYPLAQGAIT